MLVISPESAGGSKAAAAVGAIVIYVPESLPFLFLVSTKRVCHVPLVAWTDRRTTRHQHTSSHSGSWCRRRCCFYRTQNAPLVGSFSPIFSSDGASRCRPRSAALFCGALLLHCSLPLVVSIAEGWQTVDLRWTDAWWINGRVWRDSSNTAWPIASQPLSPFARWLIFSCRLFS